MSHTLTHTYIKHTKFGVIACQRRPTIAAIYDVTVPGVSSVLLVISSVAFLIIRVQVLTAALSHPQKVAQQEMSFFSRPIFLLSQSVLSFAFSNPHLFRQSNI